jgi:glycine cleavage system H protein
MSSEILELRVDKFLFRFPAELYYSDAGIWAKFEGARARIGLSDFTQQRNGDVTFFEPKEEGVALLTGEEAAIIETIKVNISVPSPVGGKIIETNGELLSAPELINQDPYGKGWLAIIEVGDVAAAKASLKSAKEFMIMAKAEAEAEILR